MTQKALSRATGLSRQTIANALADRVSATTAALIDDVLRGSPVRSRSDVWATATQIGEWANRRESQADLPRLVRRLVLATTPDATNVSFRASEGIQLPGFDGRVTSVRGSGFVPAGFSAWELGTRADPAGQATENYQKRTGSPGDVILNAATFVFVTARRWTGKNDWVAQRKAEGRWQDVRVYDADDLETWLEQATSVHAWFSKRIGVIPQDCTDLESWWSEWQAATSPALSASFLLAGREEGAKAIENRLGESTRVLTLRAESQNEAIAYFAATLETAASTDRDSMFARSVVVDTEAAWRHLVSAKNALILIPTFEVGDRISAALGAGHTVIFPLGASDAKADGEIEVGVIAREPVIDFLDPSKAGSRQEAWKRASLARRSMTAFRRSIAVAPSFRKPAWAQPTVTRHMVGALLIGSWNDTHAGDKEALQMLAGRPYDEAVGALLPYTNTTDPLLRRRGSLWYLVSPEDAWRQVGQYVTREDLSRFEALCVDLFGVVDPRLDLEPDKRWMAGVLLPPSRHSGALRRGMAATIGLVGSRAGGMEPGFGNEVLAGVAPSVVRQLFSKVRAEPRLWASLDDHLPDLAEGAPDVFLSELEHALGDPAMPLAGIFTDAHGDALFGPSSPHVDVLWALERLAWSPRYLGRVVRILGRLDAIDPKGRMANRPASTLRAIFLPWLPQTAATVDQRLEALATLGKQDPRAAWATFVAMLPEIHGVGHYSARPRWRDWSPDGNIRVTHGEYWKCVRFAASNLIALAEADGERWKDLVPLLSQFPELELEAALGKLGQLDTTGLTNESRAAMWDGLRALVAKHRNFADATWAMPAERVSQIDEIRARFEPRSLVTRFAWLFGYRPELPDAAARFDDFSAYDSEVETRRRQAVGEILREGGTHAMVDVAMSAEDPRSLGSALAKLGELADEDQFIARNLASEQPALDQLAWGYLGGRVSALGDESGRAWLLAKFTDLAAAWTPRQRAYLLLGLRPTREVWSLAESDDTVAAEYWQRLRPHVVADGDVAEAASHYLSRKRPFAAIELLGHHATKGSIDRSLILEVLENAVFGEPGDRPDQMFSYYVEKLFDALGEVSDEAESRVARLEWSLLPAIRRHERAPKVLKRVMLQDPALFVDAVTLIYKPRHRPKQGEVEATDQGGTQATRAFELLRSIRGIPGTAGDGTVDTSALRAWVAQARTVLRERDRLEVGIQEIGQLLGSAPARGADGIWPCEAVRDLIEAEESDDLEQGIRIGLYNSRGVTTRSMTTGGAPERRLATQYTQYAEALQSRWHRTAAMLHTIAEGYANEAKHHDLDVAIQEDLGA